MKSAADKLLSRHAALNHLENARVTSHVQRQEGDWVRHTLMLENHTVPFVFRRKQGYRNLRGARVNLTYYRQEETVAGVEFENMKVVRLRRA